MLNIKNICLFSIIFNRTYSIDNVNNNISNNNYLYINNNIDFNNHNVINRQVTNINLMVNHNLDEFRIYFINFLIEVLCNERAERFFNFLRQRLHISPVMFGRFIGISLNIIMFTFIFYHFDNLIQENKNLYLEK